MATVDAKNIYIGAPEQSVTGAVLTSALPATLPTDAVSALTGFTSSGYVTEDGVSLTWNRTTTDLRDWSLKTVRTIAESTTAEVSFSLLELSEEGAVQAFGASAVTATAATAGHGNQLAISITGEMPEAKAWVFNVKDGERRVRLVIPNGQVTSLPDMTFVANEAIVLPVTITCYPDDNGVILDVFTDDGQTL